MDFTLTSQLQANFHINWTRILECPAFEEHYWDLLSMFVFGSMYRNIEFQLEYAIHALQVQQTLSTGKDFSLILESSPEKITGIFNLASARLFRAIDRRCPPILANYHNTVGLIESFQGLRKLNSEELQEIHTKAVIRRDSTFVAYALKLAERSMGGRGLLLGNVSSWIHILFRTMYPNHHEAVFRAASWITEPTNFAIATDYLMLVPEVRQFLPLSEILQIQ